MEGYDKNDYRKISSGGFLIMTKTTQLLKRLEAERLARWKADFVAANAKRVKSLKLNTSEKIEIYAKIQTITCAD